MEQKNLMVRKATPKDMDLLYEMINGLATYEKRPEDMTGLIKMLKYFLFEKEIATAVIAEMGDEPIGYAIYYPTFASFAAKMNALYRRPIHKARIPRQRLWKRILLQTFRNDKR